MSVYFQTNYFNRYLLNSSLFVFSADVSQNTQWVTLYDKSVPASNLSGQVYERNET